MQRMLTRTGRTVAAGVVVAMGASLAAVAGPAGALPILNTPPTAHASATPNPAHAGDTVTLIGSGSTDQETASSNLLYSWDFGDGAHTATSSSDNIVVDHLYAAAGVYTATLTVTDPDGASDADQVVVDVDDTAPVAHATATPSPAKVQQVVAFDGSGTTDAETADADLGFAWSFGDDSTGTGVNPTHAYAAAGTYTVRLVVTDPQGATSTTTLSLQVTNTAPTAAGTISPAAPTAGETVTFDASTSSDNETPESLTYAWDFGDSTTVSTAITPTHVYAASGTYPVKLTVTDPQGLSSTKSFSLTVGANKNPTASLTASRTKANPGQSVSFDGSQSTDRETPQSLSYAWSFGDGSDASAQTTSQVTHAFATAGTYTVTLTVTDANDKTATASVAITVGNTAPTAAATINPQPAYALAPVSLDASGSSDAETPDHLQYSWTFGDGTAATAYADSPLASHAYRAAGSYTLTLRVKDPVGAIAVKTFTVSVLANAAPHAAATATPNPARRNAAVAFDASGSTDADGDTLTYRWDFPGGASASGATTSHAFAALGSYPVQLTATDTHGVSSTATVTVEVADAAPTAVATATPTSPHVGQAVSLDGSGSSDPDGDTLSYAWKFPDDSTATGPTATYTWSTAGPQKATLTVTDGDGRSASTDVTVTVVDDRPVARMSVAPRFLLTGAAVSLDASASTDTESQQSLAYAWVIDGRAPVSGASTQVSFGSPGRHRVALTVTDPQGSASTVARTLYVARALACENSHVTRYHEWQVVTSTAAGGHHCRNAVEGQGHLTLQAAGSRFGLTYGHGSVDALVKVWVDGTYAGKVDMAFAKDWTGRTVFTGLGDGQHSIEVRVVRGTANIDDLLVYGPLG